MLYLKLHKAYFYFSPISPFSLFLYPYLFVILSLKEKNMMERRKKRRKVKLCFGVQLKKEKIKSVGFLMTIFFRFSVYFKISSQWYSL